MNKITQGDCNTGFDERRLNKSSRSGNLCHSFILLFLLGLLSATTGCAQSLNDADCFDPLAKTLGYNAFVKYTTNVVYGDTDGPVATGGNFKLKGNMTLASHTAGDNFYGEDDMAASLVVGGKMVYGYGYAAKLNNGYVKLGTKYGSNIYDRDRNGAHVNLRLTGGNYWSKPRLQVQHKQDASTVHADDVIDFHAAFDHICKVSRELAALESTVSLKNGYKLTLNPGELNVLNISGRELFDIQDLTLENKPSAETPLIINIDAKYNLFWYVQNMAGVGGEEGKYIIWNFFNADNLILKGGGSLTGSVLAPKTTVYKKSSGNIDGQVVAKNYVHYRGELHYKPFEASCTPSGPGEEDCPYVVTLPAAVTSVAGKPVVLSAAVTDNGSGSTTSTSYNLIDTEYCKDDKDVDGYVLWLRSTANNRYFRNIDLIWTVNDDGTASLKGSVLDYQFTNQVFEVDVQYSGYEVGPSTNLKGHDCHSYDPTDWQYYRNITGMVSSQDGTEKWELFDRGPGLQVGKDANNTEKEEGVFNASGWFSTDGEGDDYVIGDFNFNIGEEIPCEPTYKWSNGATTSTTVVAPTETTTYTLTVASSGCNDCVIKKEIKVEVEEDCPFIVDEDETITILKDEPVNLGVLVNDAATTKRIAVENTELCNGDEDYVVWLNNPEDGPTYLSNVDLIWSVYDNGTAQLAGKAIAANDGGEVYTVNAFFSDLTSGPDVEFKPHFCHGYSTEDWTLYRRITGTITNGDGSKVYNLSTRGPGMQSGTDANEFELREGIAGASGWFHTDDSYFVEGDFNIIFGDEIKCEPVYEWSNGADTATITVSPNETKTYTVKVTSDGCNDCAIKKEIKVEVEEDCPFTVDEDETITITEGESVNLGVLVNDASTTKRIAVENTQLCNGDEDYVVWLNNPEDGPIYLSNVDLIWSVYDNGRARLTGKAIAANNGGEVYSVNAFFSDLTSGPNVEYKSHFCHGYSTDDWTLYRKITGTITNGDGSKVYNLSTRGPGMQSGTDANEFELREGIAGASGWFHTDDSYFVEGDFNIIFGNEIKCEPVYEWSNGEETATITVSPNETKTYTVKVTSDGCNDCVIYKKVTVKVEPKACEEYVKTKNTIIYNNGSIYLDVRSCKRQCFYVKIYDCYGNPKTSQLRTYVNCGNNTVELDFGKLVPHNSDGTYYIVTYLSGKKYVDRIVIK
ncbi:MAG: choice-of-anchor A family protein [Leeuwenhoekiella sp.]